LEALSAKAVVNAAQARLAGHSLRDIKLTLEGTADPKSPAGKVEATGSIDDQPLHVNADLISENGRTSAPTINAEVGPNHFSGALDFSPDFMPEGTLNFQFPDVSLLAALAAQPAELDLQGTITPGREEERTAAKIQASGTRLARDGVTLAQPTIDLLIPDIRTIAADGSVKAARIGTETNAISDLTLSFDHREGDTHLDLAARYDDAPLTAVATVRNGDHLAIDIDSFAATPRTIPIRLAAPSTIVVDNGSARLDGLTLTTGNGSLRVTGTAGTDLDLGIAIDARPASLINTFVPALKAAGFISGKIEADGSMSAPSIRYDLEWNDAQLGQTR